MTGLIAGNFGGKTVNTNTAIYREYSRKFEGRMVLALHSQRFFILVELTKLLTSSSVTALKKESRNYIRSDRVAFSKS